MNRPKFRRGDEVALINPTITLSNETFIIRHQSHPTLNSKPSEIKYLVEGATTKDLYEFRESSLYFYTPENRTKILLGLDPD